MNDPKLTVLTIERRDHVAFLWLDRPEKRNAMGTAFFDELPLAMSSLGEDEGVRAVVIAGRGPCFSVGLDLTTLSQVVGAEVAEKDAPSDAAKARRTLRTVRRLQDSISSVSNCPKPVLAAVHNWCIGGGVDLITACDIRLAAADAVFSVRETRMAMVADIGSLQRLPLVLPMGHVAEMALTGKDIGAERAERIGLVNLVCPDFESLIDEASAMATEIAANSPFAVQGTKAVLNAAYAAQVEAGLRYVAAWNAAHLRSSDLNEAVTAFFEKRAPRFTGE